MLQLLDYLTIYPDDDTTYRASDVVLAGHANAAYRNASKSRICASTYIMLSEDVPVPPHNRPFLTIAQMIKNVMLSTAKAELAGLPTIDKEIIPPCQDLIEMGWLQPKTNIQCNNSSSVGVAKETIIPCKTKSMDINFH